MNRWIAVLGFVACIVGCSGSTAEQELTVFAAASLTDAFERLTVGFKRAHPAVDVRLNFAGSNSLRTQVENGAQADLFASANPKHLQALQAQGLADEPTVFATNTMVVALPQDNPARIEQFAHLIRAERIVLANQAVPAGSYAENILSRSVATLGPEFARVVRERVVSRENDVRAALQKVVLGEADAALVYRTDAAAADVNAVDIPSQLNVRAHYPIASLVEGKRTLARQFIAYVKSPAGRAELVRLGFGEPSDGMSASR